MAHSNYYPRRTKIQFTQTQMFRVGDEFKIIDAEIVYFRLEDLKG